MSVFPEWERFAVHQRQRQTGCIPTGYEMLLRAGGVPGIDFTRFQEEFDLDLRLGVPTNNFGSVADEIRKKYPHVRFSQKSFETGAEKIVFIEECLAARKLLLVSVSVFDPWGRPAGWHIMPVVDATDDALCFLKGVRADGDKDVEWVRKEVVRELHDRFPGGREVAYLEEATDGDSR
jgi:hypothetical protein